MIRSIITATSQVQTSNKGNKTTIRSWYNRISITNYTLKLLQDIELTLPDGVETTDLKWFSVWCRRFSANFGDLFFPEGFALEGEKPVEATSKVIPVSHVTNSKYL